MALHDNFWTSQVDILRSILVEHLSEFVTLWEKVSHIHLDMDTPDTITWKFIIDGHYSATSAYKAQFFGHTDTEMISTVWKIWVPPKCKSFAWLAIIGSGQLIGFNVVGDQNVTFVP